MKYPKIVIVMLCREFGETGIQASVNSFQAYCRKNRYPSQLVTSYSAPALLVFPLFAVRKLITPLNKEWSVWWFRYWHYQCLKFALRPVVRQHSPVIYAQGPLEARAALKTRTSPATRVVMKVGFNISQADEFVASGLLKPGSLYYRSICDNEQRTLPRLDGIIYVSQFIKAALEQRHPKLSSVPNTVIPNFTFANPAIGAEKQADLITIGTLEPRKNHAYLLRVLAEAAKHGKRYTLTIVGNGPERGRLKQLAESLQLADQVTFLGFQKQAAQYLPQHRIYCHTSLMESFGIVLIEAMAAGLPVLAPPVGGMPEILRDGVEGYLWPLDNVEVAAARLIHILENQDVYEQFSQSALHRFETTFSPNAVAGRIYEFLVGNPCSV